jgi:pentatricopeptide repeat protein
MTKPSGCHIDTCCVQRELDEARAVVELMVEKIHSLEVCPVYKGDDSDLDLIKCDLTETRHDIDCSGRPKECIVKLHTALAKRRYGITTNH